MGVVKHQQVVQRGGDAPSLEAFRDRALSSLGLVANVPAHCKGLDWMTLKVSVKPNHSMVTQS